MRLTQSERDKLPIDELVARDEVEVSARERLAELIYSRLVVRERPDSQFGEDESWYPSCWSEATKAATAAYPEGSGKGLGSSPEIREGDVFTLRPALPAEFGEAVATACERGLGPDSFADAGRESAKVLDEAERGEGWPWELGTVAEERARIAVAEKNLREASDG